MQNDSKQIHVIGVNASSIENLFESKEKQIFKAERVAGPTRVLNAFKIWLKQKK